MAQQYSKATVFAALAAGGIAFGFAPILVRIGSDTSPFVLVSYRTCLAVILLFPFWLGYRSKEVAEDSSERWWIALSGVCLGLHFTCWLSSLYYTSIASASVLVAIHPIIMILVERFLFQRSFARLTWAGVILAFTGSVILGISDSRMAGAFAHPLFGNMLAVGAAVLFVIYLLLGQKIRQKREWIDYVFPVYFYAAMTCVFLALVTGNDLSAISQTAFWAGLGLAVGPQILGHGSMNYAIKFTSPTLISTLILVEPLIASAFAYIFFDEVPPLPSIFSMIIILGGLCLAGRKRHELVKGTNYAKY